MGLFCDGINLVITSLQWSYGVTVWEIMTLGEMPYSDINDRSVVSNLMMGQRLPKPDDCLDTMYVLSDLCYSTSTLLLGCG